METYLSEKGIFIEKSRKKIKFYDLCGNTIEYNTSRPILSACQHYLEITPCFIGHSLVSGTDLEFSTLIDYKSGLSVELYIDELLTACRKIECLSAQIIYGSAFDRPTFRRFFKFDGDRSAHIRDGLMDAEAYNEWLNKIKSNNTGMEKALIVYGNVRKLSEMVRFGISHSDYRLKSSAVLAAKVATAFKDSPRVEKEYINFSPSADQIGWEIEDFVKSLVTTLDGLSKLSYYCSGFLVENSRKVKRKDANAINQLKFGSKKIDAEMVSMYQNLKVLISLRNELVHNQNFNLRFPAFVGYKNSRTNNKKISYCDVLTWDINNEQLCRSNSWLGFYSQQRNAIINSHSFFIDALMLIKKIFELTSTHLNSLAKSQGIGTYLVINAISHDAYEIEEYDVDC